jgi:hypothetical protein
MLEHCLFESQHCDSHSDPPSGAHMAASKEGLSTVCKLYLCPLTSSILPLPYIPLPRHHTFKPCRFSFDYSVHRYSNLNVLASMRREFVQISLSTAGPTEISLAAPTLLISYIALLCYQMSRLQRAAAAFRSED